MRVLFAVLIASLTIISASAYAHEYAIAGIKIDHPAVNATPPGAKVAAGYLTLDNVGSDGDTLVSISAPSIADKTEIHEMKMDGDVMRMRPLKDGLDLAAGQKIELSPHGIHVMFMSLKKPLVSGEKHQATLHFKNAGDVAVEFEVEPLGHQEATHEGH